MSEPHFEEDEREKLKRWLKRYRRNHALVDRLEDKLANINERICKIKSPNYSGMPRGGDPVTLDELISDKLELEERINNLCQKGRKIRSEILAMIDELEDIRQVEVMEEFLIKCKSFAEISEDLGYTNRHIVRLYSDALDVLSLSFTCR